VHFWRQVLNIDSELADIDNLKMWLASLSEEENAKAERKKLASLEDGVEAQREKVLFVFPFLARRRPLPPRPLPDVSSACTRSPGGRVRDQD
jgi:hypothetical protein